jgi:hypothetical protein
MRHSIMLPMRMLHRKDRAAEATMLKKRHLREYERTRRHLKFTNDALDTESFLVGCLMSPSREKERVKL